MNLPATSDSRQDPDRVRLWAFLSLVLGLALSLVLVPAGPSPAQSQAPASAPAADRPGAGRPWSFEQCWQAAKENSPSVTVSELAMAEAAVGLEEADKVFYPAISASAGVTANTVEQSGLGANFQYNLQIEPILEGYEKFLAEDLARLQYKISEKGREKALAILRYRVSEAYLQLMAHHRARHHLERAVTLQRRRFNLEEFAGSQESRALFRLESQKALMLEQQRLSELNNAGNAWRLKLTAAMSLPPDTPVRVDPAEPVRRIVDPEVPTAGDDKDWKQSIQARLAGLELQLVTKQRDLADLNDLPKPIVRGGWSAGRFDESSGAYVLVGVEIPIWDWGRNDRLKKTPGPAQAARGGEPQGALPGLAHPAGLLPAPAGRPPAAETGPGAGPGPGAAGHGHPGRPDPPGRRADRAAVDRGSGGGPQAGAIGPAGGQGLGYPEPDRHRKQHGSGRCSLGGWPGRPGWPWRWPWRRERICT